MKTRSMMLPLVCALVYGCAPKEISENDAAPLPEQPAFEGKTHSGLVGKWKSTGGESKMELRKDGTSTFETAVRTPGGAQEVKTQGMWLTKDTTLLLQDKSGPQAKVIAYTYTLISPEKLQLSTSFPAIKTIYLKQK